jgi:hypothetical protein
VPSKGDWPRLRRRSLAGWSWSGEARRCPPYHKDGILHGGLLLVPGTVMRPGTMMPYEPREESMSSSSKTVGHGTPVQTGASTTSKQRIEKERVSPSGTANRANSPDRQSPPSRARVSARSRAHHNSLRQARIRGDTGTSPHRRLHSPLGPPEFVASRHGSPRRTVYGTLSVFGVNALNRPTDAATQRSLADRPPSAKRESGQAPAGWPRSTPLGLRPYSPARPPVITSAMLGAPLHVRPGLIEYRVQGL